MENIVVAKLLQEGVAIDFFKSFFRQFLSISLMKTFLIIGGGQAGYSVAASIRQRDAQATITLIANENFLPYQRPPLSKKYLKGDIGTERLFLRQQEWYAENTVNVVCGQTVTTVDTEAHTARTDDGTVYSYDKLALTTGSRPRWLPEALMIGKSGDARVKNVFTLRGISDVDNLARWMAAGKSLCIIGGGYIGLEVAAVARQMGLEVTIIEAAPRILARVAAQETAEYFREQHQQCGVKILENSTVEHLQIENSLATAVHLKNGNSIACDFVLAGIGALPETALAEQAGLAVDQGILVDEYAQTSHADIFAAGDCARFAFRGHLLRLESVQNAIGQAHCAAANMLGEKSIYDPKPWFWSDQYDIKLQIAGLNLGYDHTVVREGKRDGALSVWYYAEQRLIAVDAINDPLAYGIGKKILDADATIPPEAIADGTTNLKDYL